MFSAGYLQLSSVFISHSQKAMLINKNTNAPIYAYCLLIFFIQSISKRKSSFFFVFLNYFLLETNSNIMFITIHFQQLQTLLKAFITLKMDKIITKKLKSKTG